MHLPILNKSVPDVGILLAMQPEELAAVLLPLAAEAQGARQQRNFIPSDIAVVYAGQDHPGGISPYPAGHRESVTRALVEGWEWLRLSHLIIPAELEGSFSPWLRVSRRGAEVLKNGSFNDYRNAIAFPKGLIHPAIADQVWLALARREWDVAVFVSFRQIEVAVRQKAGLRASDIGVPLMRVAFDPNDGPLTGC